MDGISINRKQTTFRLREDVLEILKEKANRLGSTLNSYVEGLLIREAYGDEEIPNEETIEAMKEAETMVRSHVRGYSNIDELRMVLNED